jgi:hypothetical protein
MFRSCSNTSAICLWTESEFWMLRSWHWINAEAISIITKIKSWIWMASIWCVWFWLVLFFEKKIDVKDLASYPNRLLTFRWWHVGFPYSSTTPSPVLRFYHFLDKIIIRLLPSFPLFWKVGRETCAQSHVSSFVIISVCFFKKRKSDPSKPKYTGTGIEVLMETESRLIHRFRKTAFEPFLNGPKIKGK